MFYNCRGYVKEIYTYLTYPIRFQKNPDVKFVIFAVGRSGSGLLVNLLRSHPDIYCDDELFRRDLLSPRRYLMYKERFHAESAYGFKLNTYHFRVQEITTPAKFVRDIYNRGYHIISLERRNLLRQVLSHMYAMHRHKFHHRVDQGNLSYDKFTVELGYLVAELKLFESYRLLKSWILEDLPFLPIVYEDDLLDAEKHQATADKITEFLGLSPKPVRTNLQRTTPREVSDFVDNYGEIISFISNTVYAQYLEMP